MHAKNDKIGMPNISDIIEYVIIVTVLSSNREGEGDADDLSSVELVVMVTFAVTFAVTLTLLSTHKINVNNIDNNKYNVNIVFLDTLS